MGHRTITVALVLGLISLPLACGGDDDDDGGSGGTAGKAGSGGKAGSAGKGGSAGKAGSGGTGGTAGKGGSAGKAGSGGTGGSTAGASGDGGVGGESAGAGGQSGAGADAGGQGGDGGQGGEDSLGGNGGEGGEAPLTPEEIRFAKWQQICGFPSNPEVAGVTADRGPCTGSVVDCANAWHNPTLEFDASCLTVTEGLLNCLITEAGAGSYCDGASEEDPYAGLISIEPSSCPDLAAFNLCRQ